MQCPLCGATEKSTGEAFTTDKELANHIFASGDEPHKGYNYQDALTVVQSGDTGDTPGDTDGDTEDTPDTDDSIEATQTGTVDAQGTSDTSQGEDPAAQAPGSTEGTTDTSTDPSGGAMACPDCGASDEDDGFDDVRKHSEVKTASGIIDTSEIDYICWNCQEVFVDR